MQDAETNDLILKAREGDIEARNQILIKYTHIIDIVEAKLKTVKSVDSSTKRYGAMMGLLSAITNFKMGEDFGNYAHQCALRRAQREVSLDHLVKIPTDTLQEFLRKKEFPYQLCGFDETSLKPYVNPKHAHSTCRATYDCLIVKDEASDIDMKKIIKECLEQLNSVEKDAILNRYGFMEGDNNLRTLGAKHNISYEWVRQAEIKAFRKIKNYFKKRGYKLADFY